MPISKGGFQGIFAREMLINVFVVEKELKRLRSDGEFTDIFEALTKVITELDLARTSRILKKEHNRI